MTNQHKFFGSHLVERGIVTAEDVLTALERQRCRQRPIGQIALREGLLRVRDAFRILNEQGRHPGRLFGEVAVELGLMKPEDVESLLTKQRQERPKLGEVLVEMGALSREQMEAELRVYLRAVALDL